VNRKTFVLVALAAVSLSPVISFAEEPAVQRTATWGDGHWLAIGTRSNVRTGEGYTMASLGGHVRLAPFDFLRLELFLDNYLALAGPSGLTVGQRHDHEIGFMAQVPLYENRRLSVFPMVGACATWAVAEGAGTATSDIRFGIHGGVGVQFKLFRGLAAHAEVEAIAYNGHALRTWGFSSSVAPTLSWFGVGQASLGLEYWF
jgi:hypothetical protein